MKIHLDPRTTYNTTALLVDPVIRLGKKKAETTQAIGTSPTTVA